MKFYHLFLLSIGLLACSDSDDAAFVQLNPIDFSAPKEGQKSYYVNFSTNCMDYDQAFEYERDTLVVAVQAIGDSIYFEEYLTSESYSVVTSGYNDTLTYGVTVRANDLLIPNRWESRLLFFYGNDTIHFARPTTAQLQQNGCRLEINGDPFIGEEVGSISQFTVGGYKLFNKRGVSCVPGFMGTFEAYLIYDRDALYVSETIIDDVVQGWRRL